MKKDHDADGKSKKEVLKNGWEEFWSEDHARYYYYHAGTERTTWDRKEAYGPPPKDNSVLASSMLATAATAAASHADMKDLDKQLYQIGRVHSFLWKFLSLMLSYADMFVHESMDFSSLLTLTESRIAQVGITSADHASKIMNLRTIAAGLPESTSTADIATTLSEPPQVENASSEGKVVGLGNSWSKTALGVTITPAQRQERHAGIYLWVLP